MNKPFWWSCGRVIEHYKESNTEYTVKKHDDEVCTEKISFGWLYTYMDGDKRPYMNNSKHNAFNKEI